MKNKIVIAIICIAALFAVGVVVVQVATNRADNTTPAQLTQPGSEPLTGSDAGFPPVGGDDGAEAFASGPGFDQPADFGDTVTFPNGLEVTISDVEFGPANADYPGNYDLSYTVSVKNGTVQRLDGIMTTAETSAEEFMGPSFDVEPMPTLFVGDEGSEVQGVMVKQDLSGETFRISVSDPVDYGLSAIWEGQL